MGGRKEKRISLSPRRSPRRVMNGSPPSPRAFSPAVLRGVGPLCFPVEGRVFGAGRGSSGESLTSPNQPAGTPLPGRLPGNTGELPRPATAGAEPALPPSRGSLGGEGGYHYLPVPPPTRRIPRLRFPPPGCGVPPSEAWKRDGQGQRRFCWRIFALAGRGGGRFGWARLEAAGRGVGTAPGLWGAAEKAPGGDAEWQSLEGMVNISLCNTLQNKHLLLSAGQKGIALMSTEFFSFCLGTE